MTKLITAGRKEKKEDPGSPEPVGDGYDPRNPDNSSPERRDPDRKTPERELPPDEESNDGPMGDPPPKKRM